MKKITLLNFKEVRNSWRVYLALLFLFTGSSVFAQFPAPYCNIGFGSGTEPITSVQFAGINNTSTNQISSASAGFGLEDYTSISGTVTPTLSYPITLKGNTDGNFINYFRVYIDWNQDGDFDDPGESYNIGFFANSTGLDDIQLAGTITVPLNALQGTTRMRVTKRFSAYVSGPCNTAGFGQAEDYSLEVTAPPTCLGVNTVAVSDVTSGSANVTWNDINETVEGYDYYYSTNNTAPDGNTTPTGSAPEDNVELSGLISNTQYYVWVRGNCGDGDVSIWSSVATFTTLQSCFAPSALAAVSYGQSATVSWTAPTQVPLNGYQFYYSTENTAPTASTPASGSASGTTATINDLDPDTLYYVWVRSNCGDDDLSVWSSSTNFRTDCMPVIPPTAIEDFTSFGTAMPNPSCWREGKGLLGATPISLTIGTSTWESQNFNNSASHPNGKAAYINLYGEDREWIISPAIDLGDGSINYQLEFDALVIPWTGTTPVASMGEKFVKVIVSTDGGITWSETNAIRTYDNNNIPAQMVSEAIQLDGYTGIVKIGFYAYSNTTANDFRFYIDNWQVSETPSCISPSGVEATNIDVFAATINWTASESTPANGYEYYYSEVNTPPTETTTASGTVAAGVTSAPLTGLSASTQYFVWVRANCATEGGYSEWAPATPFYTLCDAPEVLTTDVTDVCGQGTATLSATASAGDIKWYATETANTALATGEEYETGLLTETTSFWVQASVSGTENNAGKPAPPSTATGTTLTNWGIVFNVESEVELKNVSVYSTTAGTLDIKIMNAAMTTELYSTGNVNITNGGTTTPNIIPLNYVIAPGTGYRMLVKASSGVNLIRENTGVTFPYNGSDSQLNVVSSEWGGVTTANYYYFYNVVYNSVCSSEREEVIVTVTEAPEIELSSTSNEICEGESVELNATSENEGYTYVLMPGNLEGATHTVTPSQTTTYTVTATDEVSGCVTVEEITVTVNPNPQVFTISEEIDLCEGTAQLLELEGAESTFEVVSGTEANNSTAQSTAAALGPNPLQNYYGGTKQQWIYTAEELLDLGFQPGAPITQIGLNLNTANTTLALNGLVIKMKNTTVSSFATSSSWVTDMVTVKPAANYTPVVGINNFELETPFVWDGNSLVIEMAYSNANSPSGGTNSAKHSPTSFVSTLFYRVDSVTAANIYNYSGAASFTYSSRNDVIFTLDYNTDYTWAPFDGLYTDEEATIPYTGESATSLYAKPETDITYTITATRGECSISADVNITVLSTLAPTVDTDTQEFCNMATVAELEANGESILWYTEAEGGSALDVDTELENGIYYASQTTANGCESIERTAVTVEINVVDAPTVNNTELTFCNAGTVADLEATGDNIEWYAEETGGTALTEDEALSNGTYYASQTVNGCESSARTAVTVIINVIEVPVAEAEQNFCNSATVADLISEGENTIWYDAFEGGNILTDETALENEGVYYAAAIDGDCESLTRTEVTVFINVVDAPQGDDVQQIAVDTPEDATLEDIEIELADGAVVTWYASEEDFEAGNALPEGTVLVSGETYYAAQTLGDCTSTELFAVTIDVVLGKEDFDVNAFSYYPNPVSDVLNLTYSHDITSVTVFNLLGQQVASLQPNTANVRIDMSTFAEGGYIVNIRSGNNFKTIKVIKKK